MKCIGTGCITSPAVHPSGNVHFTESFIPPSPGLLQYVCHPSSIFIRIAVLTTPPACQLSPAETHSTTAFPGCSAAIPETANADETQKLQIFILTP
jgi:hypothetical protein